MTHRPSAMTHRLCVIADTFAKWRLNNNPEIFGTLILDWRILKLQLTFGFGDINKSKMKLIFHKRDELILKSSTIIPVDPKWPHVIPCNSCRFSIDSVCLTDQTDSQSASFDLKMTMIWPFKPHIGSPSSTRPVRWTTRLFKEHLKVDWGH